jgi:hypothetical protein
MRRSGVLAAAAVIVVTNGVVLMDMARNRAGQPIETIQLTERELPLNFRDKENTGVAVRLNWPRFPFSDDFSRLDQTKLEGLGFDCARAIRDSQHPVLPRPAFLAFEYDGPAWERWQKSAQQPNHPTLPQPEMYSHLIPIDAATTPEPLQRKYPDSGRYLIVRGVVQLSVITSSQGNPQLLPSISEVLPGSIHVPPPLSDALDNLAGPSNNAGPRYTLTLSYGQHFEPWLVTKEPGKN